MNLPQPILLARLSSSRFNDPASDRSSDIPGRIARSLEARSRWAARLGVVELADGFATAIGQELDFRIEASNMTAVLRGTARRDDKAALAVKVPLPNSHLCTRRVLVMERLDGSSIEATALPGEHNPDKNGFDRSLWLARSCRSH